MQEYQHPEFVLADYALFGVTIIISLGIGIYYAVAGGGQKTTSEYLVGNRHMKVLPVALSLMVSFESSIMMLGFPAEVYSYGAMFWLANFGFFFAIILGVRIIVPLFHPLGIKSVYEYFELRYKCRSVRLLASGIGMTQYIFYMGIVLFGPGTALEAVTDMPFWASVVSVAAASVIYTSIGGIKAVIWTDVFQSVVMLVGILSILIKGTIVAGGTKQVFEVNAANGRLDIFDFNPDPTIRHTFWTLVVGAGLRLMTVTFNQSTVQRISSMRTKKQASLVLLLSAPAFFITLSLASLEGIVAFAYYHKLGCDPLTSGQIQNSNQIIPFMVLDIFRHLPGMPGLFMASLFSASLSTLSSGLSSLSAMAVEDYIKPSFKLSDSKLTLVAKLVVPFFGLLCTAVSFMVATIKGPMSQISASILSAFAGPLCGLCLFSIFYPWATKKGALIGPISAVLFSFWISIGKNFSKNLPKQPLATMPPITNCFHGNDSTLFNNFTMSTESSSLPSVIPVGPQGVDRLYTLSYQYIGVTGIALTILIGILVSLVEGLPKSEDVDVRYVLPFWDQIFPFLPSGLRKKLYLGIQFEKRKEMLEKYDKELGFRDYEKNILSPNEKELTSSLVESKDKESNTDDPELAKDNDI